MNLPYPFEPDDSPPRHRDRRRSNLDPYYNPPRAHSPANINIYNRADPHQENRDENPAQATGRGRARSRHRDDYPPNMYPPYGAAPQYAYPGMAPPPPGYPVYYMHSKSRSRSGHRRHSRSCSRSRSGGRHGKSSSTDPRIAAMDEKAKRDLIRRELKAEEDAEEEKRQALLEKYRQDVEREGREAKEAQEEAIRKHKQEQEEEADKEKKAWEAYEAKRKAKEASEKAAKEKKDEDYKKRLREHLARAGYAPNQIDTIVAMENMKIEENTTPGTMVHQPGRRPGQTHRPSYSGQAQGALIPGVRQQVFPKIRRKDIAMETLKHYDLQWEYCKEDSNFIVVLQELTEEDTDVLFYHTQKLREKEKRKVLSVEERKGKDPQLLLVRRKSSAGKKEGRSKSRTRERSRSNAGRLAGAVLGVK